MLQGDRCGLERGPKPSRRRGAEMLQGDRCGLERGPKPSRRRAEMLQGDRCGLERGPKPSRRTFRGCTTQRHRVAVEAESARKTQAANMVCP
eukprot:358975-Chlamydomonas_euryale.AAC.6